MRTFFIILCACLAWQQFAIGQDVPRKRPVYPFQTLGASHFPWMPDSAAELVARGYGDSWHGDGPTAATFVCSSNDLDTVAAYFTSQEQRSSWRHGGLTSRDRSNVISMFEKLGYDAALLPSGDALDALVLPEDHYPIGPYVIIDRAAKRIWYLVIHT